MLSSSHVTPDTPCLQAAVLGYLVRKHLVHSVREEFARVAVELEAGCRLPEEPLCLEWPLEGVLCFPVFRETGGSRDVQEDRRPGRGDLTSDDSMQDGRTATNQELHVTDETPVAIVTEGQLAAPVPAEERSCEPQERTQSDPRSYPSPTAQPSLQPLSAQMQSSSATLLSRTADIDTAEEYTNPAGMGAKRLAMDSQAGASGSYGHSLGPELPSDQESLLELRTQVAMELVWIKQAIASRQKVSSVVAFDGKGLLLSLCLFSHYSICRSEVKSKMVI